MTRSLVLGALLTLAPVVALAQTGATAPVTTTSKEALALSEKGVDHLENVEVEKARPLLDKALTADPEFAMAHLMRAQAGGGPNVGREHREKAVSLAGKVWQIRLAEKARGGHNRPRFVAAFIAGDDPKEAARALNLDHKRSGYNWQTEKCRIAA